jgi:hypothetical protein
VTEAKLGGPAPGPKPDDGQAWAVVNGEWVAIASDTADGVPRDLGPWPEPKGGEGGAATKV